jgi:hypothetical protein
MRGAGVTTPRAGATADETRSLRPLTDRILAWLPGRRVAWIVGWALVPWLNAGAQLLLGASRRSAIWEESRVLVVLNYAALSFAILMTLWGAGRLARQLEALRSKTANVLEGDSSAPFRGLNSVVGPLVASGATSIVFAVSAFARDGWGPALLRGAT